MTTPLERLRDAWYRSRFYRALLYSGAPRGPALAVDDGWPGDPARAEAIFQGRFAFAGETAAAGAPPWDAPLSEAALAEVHGFTWLRHIAASEGAAARRLGRDLIAAWLRDRDRYEALAWRPEILARRVLAWLAHGRPLAGEDDAAFLERMGASLLAQTRHLARVAERASDGAPRLEAAVALAVASLALDAGESGLKKGLALIEREVGRQILADGGHVERSPSAELAVLRALALLRRVMIDSGRDVPVGIAHTIDRMAPMLRLFRLGDGALAVFNGGQEESPEHVDIALARADARGKPLDQAPLAGFERLASGRTVVVVDAGPPPEGAFGRNAHAGTLGFEMSSGRDRVVVGCGMMAGASADWRRALRSTPAHSTLALGDADSTEFRPDGSIGRRPHGVHAARRAADGAIWLDTSHDGWAALYGARHARRFYLGPEGHDFRGEDRIEAADGRAFEATRGLPFAVRFHLHPGVRVSLLGDGVQALLRLPSGGGWSFQGTGDGGLALSLEESIYFGDGGERRRTEQIVLRGTVGAAGATVQWRFTSLGEG